MSPQSPLSVFIIKFTLVMSVTSFIAGIVRDLSQGMVGWAIPGASLSNWMDAAILCFPIPVVVAIASCIALWPWMVGYLVAWRLVRSLTPDNI